MALSDPYPLAFLSAILTPVADCAFSLSRFEEQSGSGNGQQWTAQLATPLWQVSLSLGPRHWEAAREINAKLQALGSMRSLLFADGSYSPANGQAAGSGVTISAIGSDRTTIALTGLPAGYRIAAGDRLSITHSSGRYYFGMFSDHDTANGSGVATAIPVDPPLPLPIAFGAAVRIEQPIIRARVPAGNFTPFTDQPGRLSTGASLTLIQKL
ncbi:hypothetical protein [Paracoccus sp. PAR01]|uniref:hypothetical protein n=1 Tax=Paracoccus sp. PAR01 TaxID=2769282 RepID=UPI00177C45BC|nr:hypothetical protein [Paracoccus sp. PAR01]MBD9528377.1 hypothetical protein [Paracoccus sp. PAR01]